MKYFKIYFFSLSLLAIAATFSACGAEENKATDVAGKEYTSAYICPMHCEGSGSDKAGECPTCKMAYVQNKDQKGSGTKANGHEGHDHGSHEGHNHN